MKPNSKQISCLQKKMSASRVAKGLSYAEVGRLADVDQAQVSRIIRGEFKTFSSNVVQICRVLKVNVPHLLPQPPASDEWNEAFASVRKILNQSQDGGATVMRLLSALADLQNALLPEKPKGKGNPQWPRK